MQLEVGVIDEEQILHERREEIDKHHRQQRPRLGRLVEPWQPPADHLMHRHYRHIQRNRQLHSRLAAAEVASGTKLPPIAGAAGDARGYSHRG